MGQTDTLLSYIFKYIYNKIFTGATSGTFIFVDWNVLLASSVRTGNRGNFNNFNSHPLKLQEDLSHLKWTAMKGEFKEIAKV